MNLKKTFGKAHFQWKHVMVLFIILIVFQLIVSYINKASLENLMIETQEWYKRESAEQLANLTTTSVELILETNSLSRTDFRENEQTLIQAFNIVLNQPLLQRNVEDMCVLLSYQNQVYAIDNGADLFEYFYNNRLTLTDRISAHEQAVENFIKVKSRVSGGEEIVSVSEDQKIFHVYVPLAPYGEYVGAVYLRVKPDFTFITNQVIVSYEQTAIIFSALILFGLMAMFYISSFTIRERDETQQLLFKERENYLKDSINRQKESLFTKRIYHTHHKAEKIMGFIKEDLRSLSKDNIEDIKFRTTQYANFISRVIYDMKWYDPPLQTIRNPLFKTNLNKVLRFIVDAIFLRTSKAVQGINFSMDLDETIPSIQINEFVIWEIIEPLIQNAIDHSGTNNITISIGTKHNEEENRSVLTITDNGNGIIPELLQSNEDGLKKMFLENISTKSEDKNSGYGCYLSYEIAKRCGWTMDAENTAEGGARITLYIPH
ncbi:MAG: histidine kinase [Calditrichaceae bacterium]|nr:histidine kinase [Calditrichaceae bacterium]MBN2708941.1 histidine kinase [Calditrichaceae bacterium]RQV97536.1 MAG: histidine kinase [Calditrichota bacterium]